MLETQKYLKSGKSLEDLKNEFAIDYRISNGKVSLKYNQISSLMSEKICQECRGLILRLDTWEIVCFGFTKFFNYMEGNAAKIDWNSSKALLKLDGSNVNLYFDDHLDKWYFCTHAVPEADMPNQLGFTFSNIAYMTLKDMDINVDNFLSTLNKKYTYCFELCNKLSQVYIYYPDSKLYLIGVRDNISLQELDINEIATQIGLPVPEQYPLSSINDIVETVNSWDGKEKEGIVVIDKFFNRIKVKNINYVIKQSLVFSLPKSDRNIIKIILIEEDDDIFANCPTIIQEKIIYYKDKINDLIKETKQNYEVTKHIDNMKEYANVVTTMRWQAVLFMLKRNKVSSIEQYIKDNVNCNSFIDSIIQLC
ncbi:MAG: RNA ligase [Ferruginibacter sp.]